MTKKVTVLAIIMLFILGVAFAADNSFGVGRTRNITLDNAAKVGDKVLAPGEYKVLHLMEGNDHILVFKSLTNQERARVKCTMEKLGVKAEFTTAEFKAVGNERVLTALVFQGDTYKHAF